MCSSEYWVKEFYHCRYSHVMFALLAQHCIVQDKVKLNGISLVLQTAAVSSSVPDVRPRKRDEDFVRKCSFFTRLCIFSCQHLKNIIALTPSCCVFERPCVKVFGPNHPAVHQSLEFCGRMYFVNRVTVAKRYWCDHAPFNTTCITHCRSSCAPYEANH